MDMCRHKRVHLIRRTLAKRKAKSRTCRRQSSHQRSKLRLALRPQLLWRLLLRRRTPLRMRKLWLREGSLLSTTVRWRMMGGGEVEGGLLILIEV
jgi:hypothetical protein